MRTCLGVKDTLTVLGSALVAACFACTHERFDEWASERLGLEGGVCEDGEMELFPPGCEPNRPALTTSASLAISERDSLARGMEHLVDMGVERSAAESVLDQVQFPPPDPLHWMPEIDTLGNILLSVEADAVVTYDGGPDGPVIAGMDIRGSRCSRSVYSVMTRSAGPWTVICLPREFGLYERMNGRSPPGAP